MKITHYDLFAGIGGFSLALDTIFNEYERKHIFCEWEAFPTAVLKQHWPDATYYGDIADLVTDTNSERREGECREDERRLRQSSGEVQDEEQGMVVLTGGFPCQPFSHAGRRQGTADNRYKWPDMFAVIRNVRPDWVIAENVRGLVTWNDGMVLETVCADLESEGYEVQPIIIPAVAVGAPHRRDRVWIIAHTVNSGQGRTEQGSNGTSDSVPQEHREEDSTSRELERATSNRMFDGHASNPHNAGSGTPTSSLRPQDRQKSSEKWQYALDRTGRPDSTTPNPRQQLRKQGSGEGMEASATIGTACTEANKREHKYTWANDWREVAFASCDGSLDDGLPRDMAGLTISYAKYRRESLKAVGNSIVPQVAMQIFEAIKYANKKI